MDYLAAAADIYDRAAELALPHVEAILNDQGDFMDGDMTPFEDANKRGTEGAESVLHWLKRRFVLPSDVRRSDRNVVLSW